MPVPRWPATLGCVKRLLAFAVVAAALVVAWRWTPLADFADPRFLLGHARTLRDHGVASLLVPVIFVALSLALFPLVVLRATTVLVFGPVLGPLYAIAGVALCALVGHAIGARIGSDGVERLAGGRVQRIREIVDRRGGILAIAALRLVPLGPFMVVNAAAGAARLRRRDFVIGTVLGLMPGLVVITVFSAQLEWLVG
jgi:phospholipase D1/2